ncbi:Lipid transfer protein-like [Rhynchospora pubera]|uniref:Lipid transfer protein-like n=1 Tax=Rhynchospora pubera TaxID=906938 RepID=A0AAV8GNC6_9POAL|nr:Lipid transfer protein-like [Rhynchospora pubera]
MLTLSKHLFLLFSIASLASGEDSSLQNKCAPQFSKLTPCLEYSTGEANTPSSDCCTSATDIRRSNAVCLCYIIQQVHAGNQNVKSLGLRVDRLLLLPSDCKMADTNVSNCPKLLNLSPSSPDYGIFTNASLANSSSSTAASNGVEHPSTSHYSSITALLSAILISFF